MARKSILGSKSTVPATINEVDIDELLEDLENEHEDEDDQVIEPTGLSAATQRLDPIVTSTPNYESKWKNDLPNDFDIFRDLTGEWLEKNAKQPVYYVIYRDSRSNYVAERYPPYSWAKLQQEFGAGYYIIIAKERGTNRVVIQQPRLVEDFKETVKPTENKEQGVSLQDISRVMDEKMASFRPKEQQNTQVQPQPSIMELLTLVFSLQEKAVSRQPQSNDSALFGSVINLVQAQNEKATQMSQEQSRMMIEMFSKMTENTNSVVRAINENQQKMFEKMNDRIEQVTKEINKSSNVSSDLIYTPQQIIEMQQKAQQTGFEMWARLETMAESKARQRMEIIESIKTEEIEEVKPKPLGEKLFETMMPALGAVMTGLARQNALGTPTPVAVPTPQTQVQRQPVRQALPEGNVRRMPQRPVQTQQKTAAPVRPQQEQAKKPATPQPVKQQATQTQDFDDLPTVDFGEGPSYMDNPKFTEYIQILQPILVDAWGKQSTIEETSVKLLSSLQAQGVSCADFLENVKYDDVQDALSEFELAPEVFTWLRGLYANLETQNSIFSSNGTVG
jgi:hypothetical protein